ncbi:MAG: acyl-protein synthetase [Myxococcota bacterium]|nr:acyl-protein synthetase [Myxococcota bacterium]
MNARTESEALHARVHAMVRAFERGEGMPEPFDAMAADLARFQAAHVPGYGRLCAAHDVEPSTIALAEQAPAVPADAFRLGRVFAFEPHEAQATFLTSGTTLGARGIHRMRDVGTYDAVSLAFGRAMLTRGLAGSVPVIVVGPSPKDAPDSSLAHMCARFATALGPPESPERTFFVRNATIDVDALERRIGRLTRSTPAIVLATSFVLARCVDEIGGRVLALPPGSRVMQTGGFKGKSREVQAHELRASLTKAFAVEDRAIVGEYGMTELSSQFWEMTLVEALSPHGVYVEPPWARVIPVDPETLAPVALGDVGIARIEDLANVDSAFAILAQDRVRRVPGGFELLGRVAGAAPRGCSIALEEMLLGE